jgi:hypothetical protein
MLRDFVVLFIGGVTVGWLGHMAIESPAPPPRIVAPVDRKGFQCDQPIRAFLPNGSEVEAFSCARELRPSQIPDPPTLDVPGGSQDSPAWPTQ